MSMGILTGIFLRIPHHAVQSSPVLQGAKLHLADSLLSGYNGKRKRMVWTNDRDEHRKQQEQQERKYRNAYKNEYRNKYRQEQESSRE